MPTYLYFVNIFLSTLSFIHMYTLQLKQGVYVCVPLMKGTPR